MDFFSKLLNPVKKEEERSFWVEDSAARKCYDCEQPFTLINRRHHCRQCGKVFCARCTGFVPLLRKPPPSASSAAIPSPHDAPTLSSRDPSTSGATAGSPSPPPQLTRLCNFCISALEMQRSISQGPAEPLLLHVPSPRRHVAPSDASHARPRGTRPDLSLASTSGAPSFDDDDDSDREDRRHSEALTPELSRVPHRRGVGAAEAHPLLHPGTSATSLSDSGGPGSSVPPPGRPFQLAEEAPLTFSFANLARSLSRVSLGHSATGPSTPRGRETLPGGRNNEGTGGEEGSWHRPSHPGHATSRLGTPLSLRSQLSFHDLESRLRPDPTSPVGAPPSLSASGFLSSVPEAPPPLDAALEAFLQGTARRALEAQGVDRSQCLLWSSLLPLPAWQAALALDPSATAEEGAPVDPLAYILTKRCLTAPSPSSSAQCVFVPGIVIHRGLVHRRMRPRIRRPRILLLAGSLEYHRTEGRLSSLETLIDQEREHLRRSVLRIAALRPDVLLVEKGVARTAQELLLAQQISVAVNVARSDLEHVARCTGAKIVPSIESLHPLPLANSTAPSTLHPEADLVLGTCGSFTVETAALPISLSPSHDAAKPLMTFRDVPFPLGSTLTLHGPDLPLLSAAKAAARACLQAAYRIRLEAAFLRALRPLNPATPPPAATAPAQVPPSLVHPSRALQPTARYSETVWFDSTNAICQGPLQSSLDILQGVDLPITRLFPSLSLHFDRPCPAPKCSAPLGAHLRTFCFGNIKLQVTVRRCAAPLPSSTSALHHSPLPQPTVFAWTAPSQPESPLALPSEASAITWGVLLDLLLTDVGLRETLLPPTSTPAATASHPPPHPPLRLALAMGGFTLEVQTETVRPLDVVVTPMRPLLDPDSLLDLTETTASWTESGESDAPHQWLRDEGNALLMEAVRAFNTLAESFEFRRDEIRRRAATAAESAAAERERERSTELDDSSAAEDEEEGMEGTMMEKQERAVGSSAAPVPPLVSSPEGEGTLPPSEEGGLSHGKCPGQESPTPVAMEEEEEAEEKGGDSSALPAPPSDFEVQEETLRAAMEVMGQDRHTFTHDLVESPLSIRSLSTAYRRLARIISHWASILDLPDPLPHVHPATALPEAPLDPPPATPSSTKPPMAPRASQGPIGLVTGAPGGSGRHQRTASSASTVSLASTVAAPAAPVPPAVAPPISHSTVSNSSNKLEVGTGAPSRWIGEDTGAKVEDTRWVLPGGFKISLRGRRMRLPPQEAQTWPVIFDEEPSSVIAHSLASQAHSNMLTIAKERALAAAQAPRHDSEASSLPSAPAALASSFVVNPSLASTPSRLVGTPVHPLALAHQADGQGPLPSRPGSPVHGPPPLPALEIDPLELLENVREGTHVRHYFESAHATYQVVDYFAAQFGAVRELMFPGGEPAFVESLARCRPWSSQGGKSQAYFAKTLDSRLILKQLSRTEKQSFLQSAPDLFAHLAGSSEGEPTALARVYGLFQVTLRLGAPPAAPPQSPALAPAPSPSPSPFSRGVFVDLPASLLGSLSSSVPTAAPPMTAHSPVPLNPLTAPVPPPAAPPALPQPLFSLDLVVLENVFHGRPKLERILDLKGSTRARYNPEAASGSLLTPSSQLPIRSEPLSPLTSTLPSATSPEAPTPSLAPGPTPVPVPPAPLPLPAESDAVLLDENLLELLPRDPLLVRPGGLDRLLRAIARDTSLLASLGVMDYSLVVGVDRSRHELVVAIIDYFRQYTWDKKMESWVKKTGLLGGGPGVDPTVISPKQYAKRFRAAMLQYLTSVPQPAEKVGGSGE